MAWSKRPVDVMRNINGEYKTGWGSTSYLIILLSFVERYSDEATLEAWVRECAIEQLEEETVAFVHKLQGQ